MQYEIVKVYPDGIFECEVPPGYEDPVAQVGGTAAGALAFAEEQYGDEVVEGPEPVLIEVRESTSGILVGKLGRG